MSSDEGAEIARNPNIWALFELILALNILHPVPPPLDQYFNLIASKLILAHVGPTTVPAQKPRFLIPLNNVLIQPYLTVVNHYHTIALILAYAVVFNIYHWCYSQNAIVILRNFVFGNKEFLTVDQQHSLASCIGNLVVVDIVIDVIWAL